MGADVEMVPSPSKRRTRNYDGRLPIAICGIGALSSAWWWVFKAHVTEDDEQMMLVFYIVWVLLLLGSCRNPGWLDQGSEPPRSAFSKGTLNVCERFDHHSVFLGVDVGARNHLNFYAFLLWSSIWLLVIWKTTLGYVSDQFGYTQYRPKFTPPLVWEALVMMALCVEAYTRFLLFFYSLFSAALRYVGFSHSILLTNTFSWANFTWGLYYLPLVACALFNYYTWGYLTVFVIHGAVLCASNMTIHEEVILLDSIAVTEGRWQSLAGLLFVLWGDIIGGVASVPIYRKVKLVKSREELPEGYLLLDESHGLKDFFGTVPTIYSKFDRGSACANFCELWSRRVSPSLASNEPLHSSRIPESETVAIAVTQTSLAPRGERRGD